jgi:hypothetical protein
MTQRPQPNDNYVYKTFKLSEVNVAQAESMFIEKYKDYLDKKPILTTTINHKTNNIVIESTIRDELFKTHQIGADPKLSIDITNWETQIQTTKFFTFDVPNKTPQLTTNKPKYVTQTFSFKHVINHVDIVQAEAEFVEKYGHLLDDNQLINRTLVDYKTKTITIEASTIKHFHPPKKANKGFIFDLGDNPNTNFYRLVDLFKPLGIYTDDFNFYSKESKVVVTSNKLTKKIIDDAKKVIELENRTNTFTKTYYFDKRPTVENLLNSQLNFLTENKLHEDDITFVGIDTNEESPFSYKNTITITGKQSAKHKTYSDDVAAVISSCVIVDRFDSLLESALKEGGSDDVIQRVISYQHPVVIDDSLELLEGPVDVNSSLQDVVESIPVEPSFPHETYQAVLEARLSNSIFSEVEGQDLPEEPIIEGNFPTNFSIADFATESLEEQLAKPFETPPVEIGDKICTDPVVTNFELNETTFGKPDKINHERVLYSNYKFGAVGLDFTLSTNKAVNDKLIEVLGDNNYKLSSDKSILTVTSNITADFIKDKIKQLGGHPKLAPEKEIRVFTTGKDKVDVNDLSKVKQYFDDVLQKYSDENDVTVKPIKIEAELGHNCASATVEITSNYIKPNKTKEEKEVIMILYNALLIKQIMEANPQTNFRQARGYTPDEPAISLHRADANWPG